MRSLPWPEMESTLVPGRTIRSLLDYLCWIAREMRQIGFHAGSERESWCRRVQQAYTALFVPMVPGYGDPYPPDVPPARNPGIWPDIPSASVSGMTLRHQLTVMEMLAGDLRDRRWPNARDSDIQGWEQRLFRAHQALDHGEFLPMPEEAASEPSERALEEAAAAEQALRERAQRRSQQLRKQLRDRQRALDEAEEAKAARAARRKTAAKDRKAASAKKKAAAAKKKAAAAKKKAAAAKKKAAAAKKKAAAAKKKAAGRKTGARRKK